MCIIFCSLFFTKYHVDLLHTIVCLLSNLSSEAWIVGPRRGNTMQRFYELCCVDTRIVIELKTTKQFDETVDKLHMDFIANDPLYVADLHEPVLLIIKLRP